MISITKPLLASVMCHSVSEFTIRKHKYDICNKAFADESNLSKTYLLCYKLIHTDIKKHQCGNCNKAFAHKSNLSKHLLITAV